jgi:hypothetical protein
MHGVEDRVRKLIEDGRAEGVREVEKIPQGGDLVKVKGWTEGIEAAVLEVAHAVDALRTELALGSG